MERSTSPEGRRTNQRGSNVAPPTEEKLTPGLSLVERALAYAGIDTYAPGTVSNYVIDTGYCPTEAEWQEFLAQTTPGTQEVRSIDTRLGIFLIGRITLGEAA